MVVFFTEPKYGLKKGYISPWRCLRQFIKPRQGVQKRTIVKVLIKMLIAAYSRTIAFDAAVECFLFLEMPFKKALKEETMLQDIDKARATSVGR